MAVANVVLNTKAYAFSSDTQGIITWLDKSGGIPTGFQRLTASIKEPTSVGSPYRIQLGLVKPVVAAADSACSCVGDILRQSTLRVTIEVPSNSSAAERTDLGLSFKDLAADAQIQAMITGLVRPG